MVGIDERRCTIKESFKQCSVLAEKAVGLRFGLNEEDNGRFVRMTQGLGFGKLECELGTVVINRNIEILALGTYSRGILPHGQESAHRRWLEQLHEMQQGFVEMEMRVAQMKIALGEVLGRF